MARSSVTLEQFVEEVRQEADVLTDFENFPDPLLYKWIHGDICEAVLRLGGLINDLYRAVSGNIAVNSAAGGFHASISHTASSTSVTGFTGLTPDAWIGGSILAVASNIIYAAQITDNDATTVTISSGTDLPELSSTDVLLTVNDSGNYINLTSLSMINFPEPVWEVKDGSGNAVEKMSLDKVRRIDTINSYDSKVYWYRVGQKIYFALGSGASISGNVTIGYYVLPTEATSASDYIDFPQEYHDLVKQKVIIRIMKRKGEAASAAQKEADLNKLWGEIEAKTLSALDIDKRYGERRT